MAKKNFIPLCMIPFIANMMGGKQNEGGEEPELPYYIFKKHDLFWTFVFETESGQEIAYGTDSLAPSEGLLAAVNAGKDILFPADFDSSYYYPEGVTNDDELDAYMDTLFAQKKVEVGLPNANRDSFNKYTIGGKTLFNKVEAIGEAVMFECNPESPSNYRLEGEENWGAKWNDVEAEGYGNQSIYLTYTDK